MIKTKIYTKPKNTGSSGGSITRVPRLQGIATEAEYASKAGRASEADKAKEAGSAQYAEQAGHAGTAGYATKAGEVELSAEALDHFARKDQDETFEGNVGFKKNVNIEGAALFADVVEMLKKLKAQGGIETDYVRSANYDEDTQQGFGLLRTKNGGYRLSLSELEVWCKAIFHELEIRKLSYAGGNVYLSGAGSKIVHVEEQYSATGVTTGWKCYLLADDGSTATQNLWHVKDQARCQSFNILEGKHEGVSNKSYWRLVTEVSTQPVTIKAADGTALYGGRLFDWVTLSATDCMAGSDTPAAGDTIVLDGASEDATRQGVLMLESTGNGTPRIVGLRGVNSYTHDGKEVFVLSPDGSRFYSNLFEWVSPSGDTIHMVNYRGEWKEGSYAYYDQVNHNNALWTCINENGTSQEPSDASSDWQKVLSGEKGDKGDKGENGITWLLTPDTLMYDTDDNGKAINVGTGKKTTLRVLRGNKEITDVTIVGVKNMVNCVASRLNNTNSFYISAIAVQKVTLGTDTIDVSRTNGSFDIDFSVDGVTYTETAKFAVNVSAFTGRMTLNNRQFEVRMTEVTGNLEKTDKKVDDNYKKLETSISTTAKSVKVEAVSQTKEDMKAAGLEITADGVDLYGDKVKVKNNGNTAAMFTDGKLNAELIDADTINVHHVWAKDGNNQNTLAHFGNYGIIEAKDEEGRSCPLWVGSSTASSSPFRVSKDGYMYAEKGAFGIRYYEDEESGEQRAYGRFEITANGIETGAVFKEDSMSLTDTRFHLIKKKGNNEKLSNDAIFLDSHGDTLPVPGLGVYLKAKVRVDASGVLNSESNVCYYANAKNGLQNYAIYGSGDISLDGSVYAHKATIVNLKTKNVFLDNTGSIGVTTYNEPQTIDSLTLLVNSQNGLALTLPTLGTIEQMLFGVDAARSKFCVRMTIIIDVGSTTINLRGRCLDKDQAGVAQWNHADFPLMFNWNGNYASDFNMAEGDSCEFLLTYDPNKNYKAGVFEQPYIARIINLQQ